MQIRRQFGLSARHTDEVAAGWWACGPLLRSRKQPLIPTSGGRDALACSLSFHSIPSPISPVAQKPRPSMRTVLQIGSALDMSAERKA
jgi:hypothetical protein